MERTPGRYAGPSEDRVVPTWGLTLRAIHQAGYRIPDLAWLKWKDLQHLWGDDEDTRLHPGRAMDADSAAFTI